MSINLAFRKSASRGYLSTTQMCSHALTLYLLYFQWFFAQIRFLDRCFVYKEIVALDDCSMDC